MNRIYCLGQMDTFTIPILARVRNTPRELGLAVPFNANPPILCTQAESCAFWRHSTPPSRFLSKPLCAFELAPSL